MLYNQDQELEDIEGEDVDQEANGEGLAESAS